MNIRKYTENDLSEMIHIWTFFHFCFSYEHNMDLHEKDADGMVGKFDAAFSRGGWCQARGENVK